LYSTIDRSKKQEKLPSSFFKRKGAKITAAAAGAINDNTLQT
jgi:hypothetical protein